MVSWVSIVVFTENDVTSTRIRHSYDILNKFNPVSSIIHIKLTLKIETL